MPISISRKIAYRNLIRISRDGSYSSEVLGKKRDGISGPDLNLIHKLTLGVLRNQPLIDSVVNEFSSTETEKMDVEVLVILRLGVYQLLFLDKIPDYSAISESVELTRYARKRSATGFVNAVLRKVAGRKERINGGFELLPPHIRTSHPEWLMEKWSKDLGKERARSIAEANNREPAAAFRFTRRFDELPGTERSSVEDSIQKIAGFKRSRVAREGYVVDRTGEHLRKLRDSGLVYFQDEASQLAGEVFSKVSGRRVLDLCAAPGSKATQLARNRGVRQLVAAEFHHHRARLLFQNAALQNAGLLIVCADALGGMPFPSESFDSVLVDAPCSGTGTLRRNPELRYRLQASDFEALQDKQLRLMLAASKLLKTDGFLVYSTCSLEKDENEEVVKQFLSRESGFSVYETQAAPRLSYEPGFIRTFPDTDMTDGFFVACLRRGGP